MPCAGKATASLLTILASAADPVDWRCPEWVYSMQRVWCRMPERKRQRRALLQLDDRQLADIGVSRKQALHEARKWFGRR